MNIEVFFKHKTNIYKSESFGQMYLAVERWIFWIAYAVIPVLAFVINLVAIGMSKTRELQAFFLYIALITLLISIFFMVYLKRGIFDMLDLAAKDCEAIGII